LGAIKRRHTQAGEALDTRISTIAELFEPVSQSFAGQTDSGCASTAIRWTVRGIYDNKRANPAQPAGFGIVDVQIIASTYPTNKRNQLRFVVGSPSEHGAAKEPIFQQKGQRVRQPSTGSGCSVGPGV
jgi:hypothetical protein